MLADARLFAGAIDLLTEQFKPGTVDAVVGIDARGFIFAAAAAVKLQRRLHARPQKRQAALPNHRAGLRAGIRPAPPWRCTRTRSNPGAGCCSIDDLLATGGTAAAAAALVKKLGAQIWRSAF